MKFIEKLQDKLKNTDRFKDLDDKQLKLAKAYNINIVILFICLLPFFYNYLVVDIFALFFGVPSAVYYYKCIIETKLRTKQKYITVE